jgi:hypothetical protein
MTWQPDRKGVVVSVVLENEAPVLSLAPVSAEVRSTALERAVAEQTAEGWEPETKPDVERVLVGQNKFRRILVRRQWGFRTVRELVEVDKLGTISVRRV